MITHQTPSSPKTAGKRVFSPVNGKVQNFSASLRSPDGPNPNTFKGKPRVKPMIDKIFEKIYHSVSPPKSVSFVHKFSK